jgi:hypothetical protein
MLLLELVRTCISQCLFMQSFRILMVVKNAYTNSTYDSAEFEVATPATPADVVSDKNKVQDKVSDKDGDQDKKAVSDPQAYCLSSSTFKGIEVGAKNYLIQL